MPPRDRARPAKRPGFGKRLLASAPVQALIAGAITAYLRLVYWTGRWEVEGREEIARLVDAGQPFIACFWHGRIMMMVHMWKRPEPFNMLISQHRDGLLITRAIRPFGIDVIQGSSRRGGKEALEDMVRLLKQGQWIGITPDGPKGPRMRAKHGVVTAARLAGVPVVPVTFSATRHRIMRSWDRFLVALPFTRGVILVGAPIDVMDGSTEAARLAVESALNTLTAEADRRCGVGPVPPDAPDAPDPTAEKRRRDAQGGDHADT